MIEYYPILIIKPCPPVFLHPPPLLSESSRRRKPISSFLIEQLNLKAILSPDLASSTTMEMNEKHIKEGEDDQTPTIIIPQDQYEWNKYGQKLIKRIGNKNRSYFRCKKKDCGAKKKVEWEPSNPSDVRVLYEGSHNHQPARISSEQVDEAAMIQVNQYDLATQIFGSRN